MNVNARLSQNNSSERQQNAVTCLAELYQMTSYYTETWRVKVNVGVIRYGIKLSVRVVSTSWLKAHEYNKVGTSQLGKCDHPRNTWIHLFSQCSFVELLDNERVCMKCIILLTEYLLSTYIEKNNRKCLFSLQLINSPSVICETFLSKICIGLKNVI